MGPNGRTGLTKKKTKNKHAGEYIKIRVNKGESLNVSLREIV
jgi:hypothetical protein